MPRVVVIYIPQIIQTGAEMNLRSRSVHADGLNLNLWKKVRAGVFMQAMFASWNKLDERGIEVL